MEKKQTKDEVDYKARLENKLYLARENPEPIFDLSDCNLKAIPKNIFSLCKVFRKEALYLQKNYLSSLTTGGSLQDLKNLKVLDISSNNFKKLPSDINQLIMLNVLNVSNNKLEELPKEIGSLENLVMLDLSGNKLKQLPDSIGCCKDMEVLKLSSNPSLKKLPVTLSKLQCLAVLDIDPIIIYPPKEICQKGIHAIFSYFLGDEIGIPSTSYNSKTPSNNGSYIKFQEQIMLHETEKAKKQKERLAVEKMLQDNNKKAFELQQQLKNNRTKVIEDVKNQQQVLNMELAILQEKKESYRASFVRLLKNEEVRANETISKILESNNRKKNNETLLEKERMEEEEEMLFRRSIETKAVEKKQILSSMDELMRKEIEIAQQINNSRRVHAVKSLASQIASQDKALDTFISEYEKAHGQLLEVIRRDEELQKTAVASLLEKSDSTSWKLEKQIAMVERHLAELTRLELSKKKLESDCKLVELNKNRSALTKILMGLFEQQAKRRDHLVATIRKMEILKETDGNSSESFWMDQYMKLLSSKSHEMVKFFEAVNPNLVHQLFLNGVFHYLPLLKDDALSNENLESLNSDKLKKLGIKSTADIRAVLNAIESFLSEQSSAKPSAPMSDEPSAPEFPVTSKESIIYPAALECVACLELKPNVIFFPCGHICCCYKCYTSMNHCPLCRAHIASVREIDTTY